MDAHRHIKYEHTKNNRFIYQLYKQMSENQEEIFGISVIDIKNNEKANNNFVTTVEKHAEKLYNIIKDNTVYPIHLNDVIYELICNLVEV